MSRTPRAAPLAAALFAILSGPAFAASANADVGTADAGPASAKVLETVEVIETRDKGYDAKRSSTATKTDTALRDVPQAITVITQELIQDQAMQGMADVVRYVPGVSMAQGEGNRDTPVFRGSASTADMFLDGVRDDVQYFRDLYNIERVEALKGPNAMIFGRGGSGGLLNRVSKQADWNRTRDVNLQLGSWDRQRLAADIGDEINDQLAFRVNVLVEETGSFRDGVEASRRGINPTLSWGLGDRTLVRLGYEHFEDERTADRGIPSLNDRPVVVGESTFFGDPARSLADVDADVLSLLIDHDFAGGATLRNRTLFGDYAKYYQNVYPSAARADQTVTLAAYGNATERENLINQTDLSFSARTGPVQHTLLVGAELGRQVTDNFRRTGYFSETACGPGAPTSVVRPIGDPRYDGPLSFCQSASDADNHSVVTTAAVYVQDQLQFSPHWQAVLGLRYDRLEAELVNNRTGAILTSTDDLLSPRAGLIYKPFETISFYGNYSLAYLPRSGEQLASLSATNAALDPEEFHNLEVGVKWDLRPNLSATAALYQLDRSNVAVADPNDPTRLVLLEGDAQRVRGVELGLSGQLTERWSLIGAAAWQDGENLMAGTDLPHLPRRTFSLWNRYDLNERWGFGLGMVSRSAMYTSTSNSVVLPGYARFDGAIFFRMSERLRMQLNVENLLDREYFASAHNDHNISPGSPRAFHLGINLSF